ncbi:hypothetical protein G5I_12312 [Acromyrmex echinatior]|uniref:Uncharacterized protein n=1 Tax=Acromyrmex echinatior TaxID=103372 RepID=F4X1Z3_ACREC|nr:hypothetical protein G5I_12312 [Acromyrmex echinatior]
MEDWTVSSDDVEAGAQRGVIRYVVTRCLHGPPGADASAILGASGAAKMPFYEAVDHAALASPRRSSTIHTPPSSPREPMDRVRRCCTGEMFQPTRLKGQLTPSCLAPLASKLPAPSTPYRPYVPPFCLYPIPIPSSHHRVPVSASYSRCVRSYFPPHFAGDSSCIPLPQRLECLRNEVMQDHASFRALPESHFETSHTAQMSKERSEEHPEDILRTFADISLR